ncbi:MAG: amidase [Gammaproteobacteria bacterium]|nr:amidase [Gammaproteobacteria bacterium]
MTTNQPDENSNQTTQSVSEYLELFEQGSSDSETLIQASLNIIDRTDDEIKAWATLDHEFALNQARNRDDLRKRGMPTGALHGIPVGIKDIIDTSELPTEFGSEFFRGRKPQHDAAVIERLKEAGAVIMGKTVTTELAYKHPSITRNPWNIDYSPGGSSSGSAAAVAMGYVPLAIGSQTHGSVIRPASHCGVYGFKPSRGMISRRGVLQTSYHLDQIGGFATNLHDLALLIDTLSGYDASDSMCPLRPQPACLQGYRSEVPIEPTLLWFDLPYASRYSDELVEGCEELIADLDGYIERAEAPRSFTGLIESHRIIYGYELYRTLVDFKILESKLSSQTLTESVKTISTITTDQYENALEAMHASEEWFTRFFYDYDAILTPSAPDIAPSFNKATTGDPCCSTIWTLAGLPTLSIPMLIGRDDMPIGIQLIGAREQDHRLFRTARWLLDYLSR